MDILINLEKLAGSRKSAQTPELPGYMKKVLITNKVITHFFITPFKSIADTAFSRPTDFSRIKHVELNTMNSVMYRQHTFLSILLLLAFILLFCGSSQAKNRVDNTLQPEGATLVPEKFLRSWDPVTLFFKSAVGKAAGSAEDHPEKFVKLDPLHPGAYTWLDKKTLQFRPAEAWPPLSRFTWEHGRNKTTLAVLVSAPLSSTPSSGESDIDGVDEITLTFASPIEPRILKQMLAIEIRPLPGLDATQSHWLKKSDFEIKVIERSSRKEKASYVITLANAIPNGMLTQVHLRLSPGDDVDQSFYKIDFATSKPFELVRAGCSGDTTGNTFPVTSEGSRYEKEQAIACDGSNKEIRLEFSSRLPAVDPVAARNLVHITPLINNLSYNTNGRQLVVRGDFLTDQLYQISLQPTELKDRRGRSLQMTGTSELFVFFPQQADFLDWQVGQGVLERLGPQMLPLTGRGFTRLDLRIHPVDPLDLSFWPFAGSPISVEEEERPLAPGEAPEKYSDINQPVSHYELQAFIKALGAASVSEIVDLPLKGGNSAKFGLDLKPYLKRIAGRNKPGTYLVGMRKLDQSTSRTWVRVQVTDLSLSTVNEPEHVNFVVTSLATGLPVAGATIEVHGKYANILKVSTNARGMYKWKVPDRSNDIVNRIVVRKNADYLVLDPQNAPELYANQLWSTDWNRWLQWTQYNTPDYGESGEHVCHVFTERPIYKPDDAVHIKGYIRNIKHGEFDYQQASKAELVVNGPGSLEWIYQLKLSADGSYYHQFKEDKLPTGYYSATFRYTFASSRRNCGTVQFQKEAYRLPKFELLMNGPAKTGLDAAFEVSLDASYYAGGKVVNRPVNWRVTQFPYTWTPEAKKGFFYSTDARFSNHGRFKSTPVMTREDVTSDTGVARILIDPTVEETAQSRRYVIEATVTGGDDQTVTDTFETLALPPFVLGLKIPRYTEKVDNIVAEIIVANAQGENVEGQEVRVTLQQRQWHSHLQAGDFSQGVAKYVTEVVDEKVFEKTFNSTTKIKKLRLPVIKAGVYIVEIESRDKMGRMQSVKVDMFAGGKEPVSWSRQTTKVFKVSTDKKSYSPGDTAKLILESPFQKARALAIVEQPDGKNRYEWINVKGGVAKYSVKVSKRDMPGLPVHFLLMRGRTGKAKPLTIDLGKPQTLAATVLIDVDTSAHRVNVELDYKKKVLPGEKVKVDISLKDNRGRALSGEVTLWLVDQAVLSLGKEQRIDPLPDFILNRDIYTRLRDTRNLVLGYFPYQEQPGGGAKSREAAAQLVDNVTVRKNFSPVPYFNPRIMVDKNGRASVTIQMPDNLTNFKVRAKVVSGKGKFGFYKGQISVRLPVIVQASLPRFVRPGDSFSAISIGRIIDGEGGKGIAQIKVDGLTLLEPDSKTFIWDKKIPQRIEYQLSVPTPGYTKEGKLSRTEVEVTVAVSRTADKASDAYKVKVAIKADRKAVKERKIYKLNSAKAVALEALTEDIRPGTLNRSLLVSTQPAMIRMSAGLSYLLEYPHGCTEQRLSKARAQLASEKFSGLLGRSVDETVRQKVIKDTLVWLEQSKNSNGLISYWPGSAGYVSLTAWSLMFITEAQSAGFNVNEAFRDELITSLKAALRSNYQYYITEQSYADKSWALAALAHAGHIEESYVAELARKADYLDTESLAQVIVALGKSQKSRSQLTRLYQKLWGNIVFRLHQGKEIYAGLQKNASHRNALILPSETRTLSEVLRAAAMMPDDLRSTEFDKKQTLIDGIVNLGKGSGWGSTNANASALIALAEVLSSQPTGTTTDMRVEITVQGESASTLELGKRVLQTKQIASAAALSFASEQASEARPLIVLSNTQYIAKADGSQVKAFARGFVVRREMLKLQPDDLPFKRIVLDKPGTSQVFQTGQVVEEHVEIVNPMNRNHVAVIIPLAAGLEPLNPSLATAPPEAKPEGSNTLKPSYTAFYDDQVAYFYDSLPKGTYNFYFRTRATIPGSYIQPAAYAEMMYDEAVNGNSNGARIIIEKAAPVDPAATSGSKQIGTSPD